jgi:hypothetical protein
MECRPSASKTASLVLPTRPSSIPTSATGGWKSRARRCTARRVRFSSLRAFPDAARTLAAVQVYTATRRLASARARRCWVSRSGLLVGGLSTGASTSAQARVRASRAPASSCTNAPSRARSERLQHATGWGPGPGPRPRRACTPSQAPGPRGSVTPVCARSCATATVAATARCDACRGRAARHPRSRRSISGRASADPQTDRARVRSLATAAERARSCSSESPSNSRDTWARGRWSRSRSLRRVRSSCCRSHP